MLSTAPLGVPAPLQNDAGSGSDAGNSPDLALLLPSAGAYRGSMWDSSDADWFRLDAPTVPLCAHGQARAGSAALATLSIGPSGPRLSSGLRPGHHGELAIATPSGSDALLGVEPAVLAAPGRGPPVDPAPYEFALEVFHAAAPPPGEGTLGTDAGSGPAGALALPGACFQGTLAGADASDWFAFDARAGRVLLASFALAEGGVGALDVVAPSGQVVATFASGEFGGVGLQEDGTWHLVIRPDGLGTASDSGSEEDSEYYASATTSTGPEPPPPCAPTCGSGLSVPSS